MAEKTINSNPRKEEIQNNQPEDNNSSERRPKSLIIILSGVLAVLVMLAIVVGYFLMTEDRSSNQNNLGHTFSPTSTESASPTNSEPVPFEELTIPYLRERSYESEIGGLEEVSTNSDYVSYRTSYDSDGLNIYGQLTRPLTEMPDGGFPAIIFVHGYIPPEEYQTFSNYSSYVDYLGRRGFVVFKIDLRGHGNSEGVPGGAYYSGDYIIDVLNAREALKNLEFVNPSGIGVWGHSMAGNVAFRSFVAARNIPAISIWSGAVYTYEDWDRYSLNDNSYRPPDEDSERDRERERLREIHGEFDPSSSFWQKVVPVNYLDGVRGAVQLNHAVNDNVVNIGYARDLSDILDNTLITHELNEYQSGGHNITGSAFNQAMENTVRFFRNNL